MAKEGPKQRAQVYKELFEAESKYRNVADFLSEFVANVFPAWFVEGKNKKILNKKIFHFVKFNRFEMFTRITFLDRFKIDDISWLKFSSKSENAKYFSNENKFVFWKVLKWLFEEVIISLLRCFFYCTEKQKEYSRIFYYRKAIWALVMNMSIEDLQKDNLKAVEKKEMNSHCENHNFAPGKLRLIPKGDTFRPIMTFNRKIPHTKNMTTNKKLQYAHMMLKNLKTKMYKHNFGFAVFSYDDIMKKYEKFVEKWKQNGSPELYFVTMDIEKCYDNVDAEKVVTMLNRTELLEKEYFLLNCFVLKRKNNIILERGTVKK
jgi:telomerase reverse transcriptase